MNLPITQWRATVAHLLHQRYELVKALAQGPRAVVYHGVDHGPAHTNLPFLRQITVKLLEPGATPSGWEDLQLRAGRVGHPNIAPIVAAGFDHDQRPFVVTRRNEGEDLATWLGRHGAEGLPEQQAASITIIAAGALARCHRLGILHLNLKPSNVLLLDDGLGVMPLLTDFGLEPLQGDPGWSAPEQLKGLPGSVRSDIYALGRLLLALASGRPTTGDHQPDVLLDTIPEGALGEVIRQALDTDPERRQSDLEELEKQLRRAMYQSTGLTHIPLEAEPDPRWAAVEGAKGGVDIREGVLERLERLEEGRQLIRFRLRHRDPEGRFRTSGAFAFANGHVGIHESLRYAWSGAEINLFDITAVPRGQEVFYTDGEDGAAVLEPYFPIPITPIVSAEGCPSRYLTDLRDRGGSNRNLVIGRIVHQMLEAMVAPLTPGSPNAERPLAEQFEDLFGQALRLNRLDLLAAGQRQADLGAIEEAVKRHFANLASLALEDGLNPFAGAFTEATRYSGEYGLEGRIDLAFDDGHVFRILELKTGNAWRDHGRQVHCYGLLWENVAERLGRGVHGELLYSKSGRIKPVDGQDDAVKRKILATRNALVGVHRQLAYGDVGVEPPHYMQNPWECQGPGCKFRRKRCQLQNRVLGIGPFGQDEELTHFDNPWFGVDEELVQLAWAWYRRFVRYIEAEYWVANARMGHILRREALPERIAQLDAVDQLTLSSVNIRLGRVTFRGLGLQFLSPGQEVLAHRGDLAGGHLLRGRVVSVLSDMVTIATPVASATISLPEEDWVLEVPPARIGHRTAHRALFDAMRTRDLDRLEILLRRQAPPHTPHLTPALDQKLAHLNPSQREAVAGALAGHPAYLVQGPPGTGKTTVIAEIITRLVQSGQRVLLAAATNTAVDNVLERLVDAKVDWLDTRGFLRFGDDSRSEELAWSLRHSGRDPRRFFAHSLARQSDDLDQLAAHIAQVPLFAGTTHRAVTSPLIEILERQMSFLRDEDDDLPMLYDVAILDEAGQVTEPMALGAINRARRFILVGDHQQLPPIVSADVALGAWQQAAKEQIDLDDPIAHKLRDLCGVRGLDQSLFERLSGHVAGQRLTVQYRMNQNIMAMSSDAFYDGELVADQSVADLRLSVDPTVLATLPQELASIIDPDHPLVLVDVKGIERGRQNPREVAVLLEILEVLLRPEALGPRGGARPFDPQRRTAEIGIISPFRAQVQLLRRSLRENLGDDARGIQVDTVERFQGGEREVMLVSFVASGRTSAHLADARRLNVTLTRARSKLVVVGNLDTLRNTSILFQQLTERPEAHIVRL